MLRQCSDHNQTIVAICHQKGCERPLLCLKCHKTHPEDHESSIKPVVDMEQSKDWIEPYERERDQLIEQGKALHSKNAQRIAEYKVNINQMIDRAGIELQKQRETLIKELNELVEDERPSGNKEFLIRLDKSMRELEEIKFRDGDVFQNASTAKQFNETTLPEGKSLAGAIDQKMESWALDAGKFENYTADLSKIINEVHLENLFINGSLNHLKSRKELQEENESLKKKTEVDQKTIKDLNAVVESSNTTQNQLRAEIEALKQEKDVLQAQVNQLNAASQERAQANAEPNSDQNVAAVQAEPVLANQSSVVPNSNEVPVAVAS